MQDVNNKKNKREIMVFLTILECSCYILPIGHLVVLNKYVVTNLLSLKKKMTALIMKAKSYICFVVKGNSMC